MKVAIRYYFSITQAIEIVDRDEHMTNECPFSHEVDACSKCKRAFPKSAIKDHSRICKVKGSIATCPLCQKVFASSQELKGHIMKGAGCPMNDRSIA